MVSRPGFGPDLSSKSGERIRPQESLKTDDGRIDLSGILWIDPERLRENPHNEYPPLSGEELLELARDIAEKGVLVPLIVRVSEDVLICGHNRRRASIEAKEPKVPVQRVLRLLSEEEEREIMRSENDRRRGGSWSKERKEGFIREHFGERLEEDNRGAHKRLNSKKFSELLETENKKFNELLIGENVNVADQGSVNLETAGKKFTEPLADQPANLAKEIEEKSKGNITEGTAKRIIAGMRKEKKRETPVALRETEKASLSEKDRRRGEKLAIQLKTLRQTRALLEEKLARLKEEEKRMVRELKTIGQPELFGVDL
jgi:ParB-like chromosome segregation protein Spo0J